MSLGERGGKGRTERSGERGAEPVVGMYCVREG